MRLAVLPSVFQLNVHGLEDCSVAVASRVIRFHPGSVESWDLVLYGKTFEALTSDPFSFAGDFLEQGLRALATDLLGPAGFTFPPDWYHSPDGNEYFASVQWQSAPPRVTGYG